MIDEKISVEKLPSYMIGFEEGVARGEARAEARAIEKGVINIYRFIKDVKEIANMFSISEEKVLEILKKEKKI